jgi:acyl-coenzyme A synthetase/AMP-(fatty) acid ligase
VIAVPLPVFDQVSTPSPLASAQTGPPAGGYLLYTSGTTGTYKKLFYEPAKEEKALDWMRECFLFDRTSVFHAVDYPPWAAIGSRTVSSVWFAGGCVVLSGSPGRFEGFFRHQPTRAILVPAMLARLLQTPQTYKIPSPFTLGVTGGFLPLALAQEAVRKLTPSLNVIYGSSELTALMYSRFRTLEDLHWLAPYGDNVIEVVDSEQKDAIGAEGELRIRLRDFDPRGYFDDAEASHRFFRDGYFYPGDLAFKREDGRIRVLGRVEDVLNLQGWKVAVAPLEERIQRALHVDAVCAFSELDDEGKDRVVIAVEADRRLPDQDLRASIHDMRGFEDVRWVFLKSFPRTTAGMNKVDRRTLRTLLRR